jgi:FixJ family two-component response regulator
MIYIIDDDKRVLRGFQNLLKSAGYESVAFNSGEEFLNSSRLTSDDLLLLDMHMPGMNGCEVIETLTNNQIHIPVIIITAYDEVVSRECAKKYGALAYLRKPVDGEALIDLIKYSISFSG